MALDDLLKAILVDPEDKQPLWYFEADDVLYNPRLHRIYPIRDGIPVLLVGEARIAEAGEQEGFTAREADAVVTGRGAPN